MTVPNALQLECHICGDLMVHEVLKGKMGRGQDVIEATVKCQECGTITNVVVREPKTLNVPVIISELGQSKRESIELAEDEEIEVEEEMFVGELPVIISAIECGGRRVPKAKASDITTLWAKRFDKIRVKVAINKVHKTLSVDVEAAPDEEFYVGDLMTVGKDEVLIHYIMSTDGMVRRGMVPARDIVRIYTKKARNTNY
ncbi:MAG: HVO_0476 family zinc finger protein [Methanomassiliicoccales archaeon]